MVYDLHGIEFLSGVRNQLLVLCPFLFVVVVCCLVEIMPVKVTHKENYLYNFQTLPDFVSWYSPVILGIISL